MRFMRTSDPRRKGIKLEKKNDLPDIVINGATVQGYWGSNGEEYERVTKAGIVKWLRLKF